VERIVSIFASITPSRATIASVICFWASRISEFLDFNPGGHGLLRLDSAESGLFFMRFKEVRVRRDDLLYSATHAPTLRSGMRRNLLRADFGASAAIYSRARLAKIVGNVKNCSGLCVNAERY
jgi:hypothetical protein